jgi:hypothetical protein
MIPRRSAATSSSPDGVVDRHMTTSRAIGVGAAHGAGVGLFLSLFLFFGVFFDLSSSGFLGVLAYGIVAGTVFGALWGGLIRAAGNLDAPLGGERRSLRRRPVSQRAGDG